MVRIFTDQSLPSEKKTTFNKDAENPTEKTSKGGSKKCVIIGGIVALAIIAVALLVGFFVFHRELKGMGDISDKNTKSLEPSQNNVPLSMYSTSFSCL